MNNSNTKWVTIGIKPSTKIISSDATGFYAEIAIDGKNMSCVTLDGLDGFSSLCAIIRTHDDFKYAFPATAGNYAEINSIPFMFSKKFINGNVYYEIKTINNGVVSLAMNSIMEMLKFEQIIIAAFHTMHALVDDVEKKFNDIVNKSKSDYSAVLSAAEKTGDLLTLELLVNFNALLKLCIENGSGTVPVTPVSSRKRVANSGGQKSAKRSTVKKALATIDLCRSITDDNAVKDIDDTADAIGDDNTAIAVNKNAIDDEEVIVNHDHNYVQEKTIDEV